MNCVPILNSSSGLVASAVMFISAGMRPDMIRSKYDSYLALRARLNREFSRTVSMPISNSPASIVLVFTDAFIDTPWSRAMMLSSIFSARGVWPGQCWTTGLEGTAVTRQAGKMRRRVRMRMPRASSVGGSLFIQNILKDVDPRTSSQEQGRGLGLSHPNAGYNLSEMWK
jgi:hypothetical protein